MTGGEGSSTKLREAQWQEIVSRVRKVQALTDSPNVNEAAAAAAKLQELLFRYNLSLSQLDANAEDESSAYTTHTIDVGFVMGETGDWRIILVGHIARFNFCRAVFYDTSTQMSLVGEPHNLEVVKHLYEFLAGEVVRLAKREWKRSNRRQPFDRQKAIDWVHPFCQGAVATIRDRLSHQFDESQSTSDETQALVVVKDQQLESIFVKEFPNTTTHTYKIKNDHSSYNLGRTVAYEINLAQQVRSPTGMSSRTLGS